jgi:hypothetical protein
MRYSFLQLAVFLTSFVFVLLDGLADAQATFSWYSKGQQNPSFLLEEVFSLQPSIAGINRDAAIGQALSHLLYELRDSNGGPCCIAITNTSLSLPDVCTLLTDGTRDGADDAVRFDWESAKGAILLFDAASGGGQTSLPSGRVHLALAQLPPGHLHRVSFPLEANGPTITCRVSKIWSLCESSSSSTEIPDLVLPPLRGAGSSISFVTSDFRFPESFIARAAQRSQAPCETSQAARRHGQRALRGRSRSTKELFEEDRGRHAHADLHSSDLWSTGLTLRVALANDAFKPFHSRPFQDGRDNFFKHKNGSKSGEDAAFINFILSSLLCEPLPCLVRNVKQYSASFVNSLPDHPPQRVPEFCDNSGWQESWDEPSTDDSPCRSSEENCDRVSPAENQAPLSHSLLDLSFNTFADLRRTMESDRTRFPPLLTTSDVVFASPRLLVIHVSPRELARRGFHVLHRAEIARLVGQEDIFSEEILSHFERAAGAPRHGKLSVGTFALTLTNIRVSGPSDDSSGAPLMLANLLGVKKGSSVLFPDGATTVLLQSFHAFPAPTFALRVPSFKATLQHEAYFRRQPPFAPLELSWQCLLEESSWSDQSAQEKLYRSAYCDPRAFRSTIMLELTSVDKVEWSSSEAKEATRSNSLFLHEPSLGSITTWCRRPRGLAAFVRRRFLDRVEMFVSMPQDVHLVARRNITLAEIEEACAPAPNEEASSSSSSSSPRGSSFQVGELLLSVQIPPQITAKRQPTEAEGQHPLVVRVSLDLPAVSSDASSNDEL